MPRARAHIAVLAGVNGAGKSSIAGAMVRQAGGDYFDPDETARKLEQGTPPLTRTQANVLAWEEGVRRLESAIASHLAFTIESTLGGSTITRILEKAARAGADVRVWFAGLSSVDLHLMRVAQRVRAGGHDIAEIDIRRRYRSSRRNLIQLLPHLAELQLWDNSEDGDPRSGEAPKPVLVLHVKDGRIVAPADLRATPGWAKPIVAAALKAALQRRDR